MKLSLLSLQDLDVLIAAARAELVSRRRAADDVRLMLQAAVALEGWQWHEVFPECVPLPIHTELDAPCMPRVHALLMSWAELVARKADREMRIADLQTRVGASEDWPGFIADVEIAVRQGLMYFRGRDHLVLSPLGVEQMSVLIRAR